MVRRGEGGFTLIEIIFGATIMTLMIAAIGGLYMSNLQTVTQGKARAIGLALANEKIEHLRDLPYDSLSTEHGTIYPPGNILDDETVTRNNFKFRVHTDILYVDDAYDGYVTCPCASGPAAGKPKDLYPYDYKKAQISVYLISSNQRVASITTDVAGKAAETSSNTGILSITVLNANGQPVPNANVHIVNTVPNPDVDINTTTDNNGLVVIPKLPPDSGNNYKITASLAGYSTDETLPDASAVKRNPNVLAQQISAVTLSIDQLSTLYVNVKDTEGDSVENLAVTITGSKKTTTSPDVFKYSQSSTTNGDGDITLTGMEWDGYSFSLPAGYYLVTSSPYAPVSLDPNSSLTVNLVVTTNSGYPTISSVSPTGSQTGTNPESIVVTGTNLSNGTTLRLRMSGQSDITASGCTSALSNTQLTCSLNLTGAATGAWSIVVGNNGNNATQAGGFNVAP